MRMLRKTFKGLLASVVLCSALAFGAACKDKEENVTLQFDVDGGVAISDVTAKKGETVTLPTPTREGYQFEGWYLNENFDGQPVEEVVVDSNVTYYAKWTQLAVITLDLNGGALSTTQVYAPVGSSIYDAVKDYTPTKAGFVFGAWFNGSDELAKNTRITGEGITLTAQYKVTYAVEVYVQNVDNDEYTKSEELSYAGADYVGVSVTADKELDGFTKIEKDGVAASKELTAVAADNILTVYYDREVYRVVFNPNAPDGSNSGEYEVEVRYGAEVEVPASAADYFVEGYCMLGWSTGSESDEIAYKTNLDDLIYNKTTVEEDTDDEETEVSSKIIVSRPTMLYGVWQAGATDLFGGNDYIYTFEGEEDVVYLARGNVFFKGEYNTETGEFFFMDYANDELGEIIVQGIMFDYGKFLYKDPSRASSAILYKHDEWNEMDRVQSNVKIRYDALNGIEYTIYDDSNKILEESKGTYENVGVGEYKATFTEGPMAGQTIQFMVGTITLTDETGKMETESAFQIRNDEEYNLGKLLLSGVIDNGNNYSITQTDVVYLELTGYGYAIFTNNGQSGALNYLKDENGNYQLTYAEGVVAGVLRLTKDIEGISVQQPGYILYDETCDRTFTLNDGSTLTLDGVCMATYQNGDKTIASYYIPKSMPMGETLISILDTEEKNEDGTVKVRKFLVLVNPDNMAEYEVREVAPTYAEYYYKAEDGLYYVPMLVIDDMGVGTASVYGLASNNAFVKVLEGTYEAFEHPNGDYEGLYQFTTTKYLNPSDVMTDPIDLSTIQSFVFATNEKLLGYSVHYWFNEGTGEYYTEKGEGKTGSLLLAGGMAYYKELETKKALVGVFTNDLTHLTFTDASGHVFYFSVDYNTKTFEVLETPPVIIYLLASNNIVNNDEYLRFDGKGGAIFYYKQGKGDSAELVTTTGTVKNTGKKTDFDSPIYIFESTDGSEVVFKYIFAYLSDKTYFLKEETLYSGSRFVDLNDSTSFLTVDGYCSKAIYKLNGKEIYGVYYVTDEGEIVFLDDTRTTQYTFDVQGAGVMTVRGQEEGVYVFFENSNTINIYCELDGYGNVSVFTLSKVEGTRNDYERIYIDEAGKYVVDENYYFLTYTKGGQVVTQSFENRVTGHYGIDGEIYIILMLKQPVDKKVLIDTSDWAVLILDDFNNAIKYNAMGQKQTGNYTVITDELLYFINKDGSDACIYDYNMDKGTATPVTLVDRTYYTMDLQSLQFTKYGFAILNGNVENPAFFTYEKRKVTIYRRPDADEDLAGKNVSEYGFIIEEFGEFEETKEYHGVTYYRSGGGDIRFEREGDLSLYPIIMGDETWKVKAVQFTPGGGVEFNVSAVADIEFVKKEVIKDPETGEEKEEITGGYFTANCAVGRELDEEGNARLFVLIEGCFRLYMDATFTGRNTEDANNTYVAEDLQYYQYLYSSSFLNEFYRTYTKYGAARANALKNEYGYLLLTVEFDENGEPLEEGAYNVSGEFGEKTKLYDTNGKPLETIEKGQWLSIGGISYVSFTMSDSYEYRLYFAQTQNPYLGIMGYSIYAFVRVEKFDVDGYTVEVGKALYTEIMGVAVDDVFFMSVTKEGDAEGKGALDIDDKYIMDTRKSLFKVGDIWHCADRELFEDLEYATQATYYLITVTENDKITIGDGDDEKVIYPTYKSVTLEIVEAKILRETGDVMRYVEVVEVDGESKVALIWLHKNIYVVETCSYDPDTQTYTVTTTDFKKFTVKMVDENHVLIEEVK